MGYLLQHGTVIKEKTLLENVDVLIEGMVISKMGQAIDPTGHEVIDCTGKCISPGFIDMHVHLREPGFERRLSSPVRFHIVQEFVQE